jgi:hypothetical protein
MDLLGCLIMAQVTTVGGGTIRDLFLNHEQGTGRARARRPQPPMLAARSAAPAARPGFLTARAAAGQGKRAFWISEPEYLAIGQVFGALTFFFWNPIAERLRLSQDDAVFFWWDKTPPPSPPVLTGHVSSLQVGHHRDLRLLLHRRHGWRARGCAPLRRGAMRNVLGVLRGPHA